MSVRRIFTRLFLLVALAAPIASAFAQAPPAIGSLPDSERRTAYSITSNTCVCAINLQLFASGSDVDAWISVWVNGVRYLSTDPTYGWSLSSVTGSLSTIPRPITDAKLTFNNSITGTVQIVGAERPRQLTQFQEGRGVAARDLNQRFTEDRAIARELWDKTSDLSGRGLFFAPGNTTGPMPSPAACANAILGFDGSGLNPQCDKLVSMGALATPGTTVPGDLACWNNTVGSALSDCGSIGTSTRIRLTGNTNFYVNGNSTTSMPCNGQTCSPGSDSNNGLTITTPFLTGLHAVNVVQQQYDSNGFAATIVFADAAASSAAAANYPVSCDGAVIGNPFMFLQGNASTPTSVHMTAPNGGVGVFAGDGCEFKITDIEIDDAGSATSAVNDSEHSIIDIVAATFGAFNSSATIVHATKNAVINFNVASSTFLGGGLQALLADNTGIIQLNPGIQFNVPNNATFTNVASAINGGLLKGFTSSSFNTSGTVTTTGPRALFSGTVLNFAGSSCAAVFPGSTACSFTNLATDDTNEGTPAVRSLVAPGFIYVTLPGVNFNSGTTDVAVPLSLPQGMTRFSFNTAYITNASHTLVTATIGVFGTTGGGAPTMAADQAITVSATTDATNNNLQSLTATNGNSESYLLANLAHTPNIYARIGTPEGAGATGDLTVIIRPLP